MKGISYSQIGCSFDNRVRFSRLKTRLKKGTVSLINF